MKLLVIGSAPQSNICINSKFVSGYHAELIILDSGDVFIVDKQSTNGTVVNGTKLAPNVEVAVKRGDVIMIADSPLDWSKIPDVKPDNNAKRIIGIGSHNRNKIHVAGDKVSRFHATIKEMNDGKWFICDHSTNGTTLNGTRIPKDMFVKLSKKDQIKCAGIPVDNPSTTDGGLSPILKVALACLAVILVGGGLFLGLKKAGVHHKMEDSKIYADYSKATVLLYFGYHYTVSAGSLDVRDVFGSKDIVVYDGDWYEYNGENSMVGNATGFYISNDGLIATNLHVARPWIFDEVVLPVEDLVRSTLNRLAEKNHYYLNFISQVKVTGELDFCYAIPNGNFFDTGNAIRCTEYAASEKPENDAAVMQALLAGGKLPEGSTYIDLGNAPNKEEYKPGVHTYVIGFPMGLTLQDYRNKPLQATGTSGAMNNVQDNIFGLSALATSGSSGSPVFNQYGQCMGMISSGYSEGFNFAVMSSEISKLLKAE